MQLMKRIVRRANHAHQWVFYLEELANMGHIPHYLQYISYVGGLGVSLIQAAQDFGQLERIYGEDGRSTILANSATQLVFPGCGLKEATYYSDTLGYTTTYSASSSWQDGKLFATQTRSRAEAQRKLVLPDELRTLSDGQIIVCSKNRRPIRIKSTPYYRDHMLVARTRIPTPQLAGEAPVLALPAPTTRPHPGPTSAQAEPPAPVVAPKTDAPAQEPPPFVKPDSWL
jgi:type IV secretory pathway TraG/TraD family ATPase VirD4